MRQILCDQCGEKMGSYIIGKNSYHYDLAIDLVGIKIRPYSTQTFWPPDAKRDFCLNCVKGFIASAVPR